MSYLSMIESERIIHLNASSPSPHGEYVLYWMQSSVRTRYNHALAYAIEQANIASLPLVIYFELIDAYPEANVRHYTFLLDGLRDVHQALKKKGIPLVISHKGNSSHSTMTTLSQKARLVVTDRGYTRFQRQWREEVAYAISIPLIQVESDIIIPVETASQKEEYTASTIRKKIHAHLTEFLKPLHTPLLKKRLRAFSFPSLDLTQPTQDLLQSLALDTSVPPSPFFVGGEQEAQKRLQIFLDQKLLSFSGDRNDPTKDSTSHLSPYLHFGHISPLDIILSAQRAHPQAKDTATLIEELIVRRELAINFVFYNPRYDTYECLPDWAQNTLGLHAKDAREYIYTRDEFESAKTHDPYWNSAQREMVLIGKMHGYMRMYWGKKILEWSKTPEEAFDTALYLNNKYELDGRDPNGFAGVAWCFGKHDRPWIERPIFGMIRYMNDRGLERKFDIEKYVDTINRLSLREGSLRNAVSK